jgi:uncharacterized protein (TIGR00304 family)
MGLFIIAIGLFLVITSIQQSSNQINTSYGGVVLIGPIPIIFGSSPKIALLAATAGLVITIITFFLIKGTRP